MTNRDAIRQLAVVIHTMLEQDIHPFDPEETPLIGEECGHCHQTTTPGADILHNDDCPIVKVSDILAGLEIEDDDE